MNQLEEFVFRTHDYIINLINKNDLIFDYELTQLNKYSNRTIYELINDSLDNNSDALYNILFELNYIPKYIEQIMTVSDIYNTLTYNYKYLSNKNKYFDNLLKTHKLSIYLNRTRFDDINKMIKSIINKKEDLYLKMEKNSIDLKNKYDNFININNKEFMIYKFKYFYNVNGLYVKKLKNRIINYFKNVFDFYFNNGNNLKKYISNNIKDCEKSYEEGLKAIRNSLEILNSDKIKDFVKANNHIEMSLYDREITIMKSISDLINFSESTIIKIISTYNIMKNDKYRKFR